MAASSDKALHWCTEEIPIGSKYFQFDQSFTDSAFLGSLQREGSWVGDIPLIQTDTFDIHRLQYLVPTLRYCTITSSSRQEIKQQLVQFSQTLLQPLHDFVYVFTNFDFCDPTEYFPSNNIQDHEQYSTSIPLFIGKEINQRLIESIRTLMVNDHLECLTICQDIARTGVGFRCGLNQSRFMVRATVEYKYPGTYTVDRTALDILVMNQEWRGYVKSLQSKLTAKQHIPIQQEKLWTPLFTDDSQTNDSNIIPLSPSSSTTISSSVSTVDEKRDYKIRKVSDLQSMNSKQPQIRSKHQCHFTFYDFSQNRYCAADKSLELLVSALTRSARDAVKSANMQREFGSKIGEAQVLMQVVMDEVTGNVMAYVHRVVVVDTKDINLFLRKLNEKQSESGSSEIDSKTKEDVDDDDNDEDEIGNEDAMNPMIESNEYSMASLIVDVIKHNIDEFHTEVLRSKYCVTVHFVEIINALLDFLKLRSSDDPLSPLTESTEHKQESKEMEDDREEEKEEKSRSNVLLLQERAIIVLADVFWYFYKRFHPEFVDWISSHDLNAIMSEVSSRKENIESLCQHLQSLKNAEVTKDSNVELQQYYGFLEPFLKASNERELQDFNECAQIMLTKHRDIEESVRVQYQDPDTMYTTESGMRVGISSANASDNWTNSKLNGGVTINMSINLDSIKATPVMAKVSVIPNEVQIALSTTHTMSGHVRTDRMVFTDENASEFVHIDDNKDVFRMLKYAIIFVGIVRDPGFIESESEKVDYSSILRDIKAFTGGHGLALSVTNLGPSRSGFASSSAVACNLLKVLYAAIGNPIADDDRLLGSMALLLENRLGLKSGRQDVDGLLPNGVKVLRYPQSTGFVEPEIEYLSADKFDVEALGQNMILVNSGIARASGLGLHRGLNMRFLAYLSRDPVRFKPILQSYGIHQEIVKALQMNNCCFLGRLFLDYMACRERIDPGATQSRFDADDNGRKVLRKLFDPLVERRLIFGGMFTGAMGGGVAMLCLTPMAKEESDTKGFEGKSKIECALDELKAWKTEKGTVPFERLSRIEYSVNVDGIRLSKIQDTIDVD